MQRRRGKRFCLYCYCCKKRYAIVFMLMPMQVRGICVLVFVPISMLVRSIRLIIFMSISMQEEAY